LSWKVKHYRVARVEAKPEVLAEAARYLRGRGVDARAEGGVLAVAGGTRVYADGRVEGNPYFSFLLPLAASKLALAYSLGRSMYLNHGAVGFGRRGRAVAEVSGSLIELRYRDVVVPAYYESGMRRLGFELAAVELDFKPVKI
jgi:hypothetical protein